MTVALDLMVFLRSAPALRGLADEDLAALAPALRPLTFKTEELICRAGELNPREFYFIRSGAVRVLLAGQGMEAVKRLGPGECFGQAVLLRRRLHPATLQAAEATQLLALSAENFKLLVENYPHVRARLLGSEEVQRGFRPRKPPFRWRLWRGQAKRGAARPRFDWLHRGEKIYLVTRRHGVVLAEKIWLPSTLWAVGWIIALALGFTLGQWQLVSIVMLLIALAAGVFVYTGWLNWSNDYFVVTNRRVVHIERDLFYSETREETFLSGIRALDFKKPDYVARQLNMGHLTVKTLAEPVSMTFVPEVERLHRLLKKLWDRSQTWRYEVDKQAIRQHIQPIVHPPPSPLVIGNVPDSEAVEPETLTPTPVARPSFFRRALRWSLIAIRRLGDWLSRQLNTSFARLRYEEGDVVTYRKHWFLLTVKLAVPSTILLVALALLIVSLTGSLPAAIPSTIAFVPALLLLAFAGGWWLYVFEDWRNDLYQINLDTIIALRRKPLGEEERSESPLDKVIKLKFERPTFLAVLLDYGTVVAKVSTGDGEFRFEDVADPAAVQQDVSRRLKELQDRKQREDREKRRAELKDWFTVYHGEANAAPPAPTP